MEKIIPSQLMDIKLPINANFIISLFFFLQLQILSLRE